MLTPIMDNAYLDVSFWFVDMQDIWTHWKQFCGENSESAWLPQTEYQIPSISSPKGGFATGTIADYLGIPVGVEWSNTTKLRPSALPFRAYALICNEFWRDQNLTDPLYIPLGDENQTGTNGDSYITDVANGGKPFIAAKYHDYFTSGLKEPQKGPAVPLFPVDGLKMPVRSFGEVHTSMWPSQLGVYDGLKGIVNSDNDPSSPYISAHIGSASSSYGYGDVHFSNNGAGNRVMFSNLWTDPSEVLTGTTINEFMLAYKLQQFYHRLAVSGSRYAEILLGQYGVTSPDATLHRPEFLGSRRVPVAVHQVTNTSQAEQDFLGDLGAMSVTSDSGTGFQKSFTTHGYIMGLVCLRYDHSYQDGFEKFWLRRKFTDFYLPVFANLGEQPTYTAEIKANNVSMSTGMVFNYQEAYADYRFAHNRISGEMRVGIRNSLGSWHLGDHYDDTVFFSDEWIREDKSNIDRVLAVTSQVANQCFADFYFDCKVTRPMPLYSIPGITDHTYF